jgi:hypothetical protein
MNSALTSIILLIALVAMVLLGQRLQWHLPEHHLSADSKDAVKLALGLVATMTALLLGLLVSSAKGTYDTRRTEVIEIAAKVTLLDRVLTAYGPDATEARARFREAIAEGVQRAWADEAGGRAHRFPITPADYRAYAAIVGLSPRDDMQRDLKARAATLAVDLQQLRTRLLAQRVPSILKPLLIAVICWLVVIFLGFGLLAPLNATVTFALIAAAVSVASAVFLIMELDQPLGGMIRLSGEPMVNALNLFTTDVPGQ